MLKGGLPRWFNLSDSQVVTIGLFTPNVALVSIALNPIIFGDGFAFAGFMVMFVFFVAPIGVVSSLVFPTHRLKIFYLPALYVIALFFLFQRSVVTDITKIILMLFCYAIGAFAIALIIPELRFLKRLFPSLQFVEKPLGANTDGAPGS